jgi:hypothetical protein
METKHFYDLWECNADGFPIKQFGVLPEFCIPSLKEGDPTVLTYLDGWEVRPTGEAAVDMQTGRKYAEMTVAYARKTGSPAFISFVLEAINLKTLLKGNNAFSVVEIGFFQRLAQITFCGSLN